MVGEDRILGDSSIGVGYTVMISYVARILSYVIFLGNPFYSLQDQVPKGLRSGVEGLPPGSKSGERIRDINCLARFCLSIDINYPPKFNMDPKNDGFQKESPIPGCHFQFPC